MSHFGRSGPPDIRDTYSLLVLNISFRTNADDLFPLFDRYGKVVDVFIPRDRRSGDSRGFAFIRYKHSHEAKKAVERLDGRNVDGRNISVQFAKYGREMETIQKGRITRENFNWKRSRSRSPRRSRKDDHYHGNCSSDRASSDRHDHDRHHRYERGSSKLRRTHSYSPTRSRSLERMKGEDQSQEDNQRNSRRRTPERRVSPQSSRDSSPRKARLSPASNRNSPQASLSPDERKISPITRNRVDHSRSRTPDSCSRSASLNSNAEVQ